LKGRPTSISCCRRRSSSSRVSDAYCRATLTERDHILAGTCSTCSRTIRTIAAATGVNNLRASLVRVLQFAGPTRWRCRNTISAARSPKAAGFEERYWAPLNSPVLNAAGEVAWIIHRVEDVTEIVRLQESAEARTAHCAQPAGRDRPAAEDHQTSSTR
jgi:hypothetical protein